MPLARLQTKQLTGKVGVCVSRDGKRRLFSMSSRADVSVGVLKLLIRIVSRRRETHESLSKPQEGTLCLVTERMEDKLQGWDILLLTYHKRSEVSLFSVGFFFFFFTIF